MVSLLRKGVPTMEQWKNAAEIRKILKCEKVTLGPSNVSGLGVFATTHIKKDDVVCIYSGELLETVPANNKSKYILTGYMQDPKTKKPLERHLDSNSKDNAIAMYINDACDDYGDNTGVPGTFRTLYSTNVKYGYASYACL